MNENSERTVESNLIPYLKLVLNGGSDVMDSATIPFRVGFTDEVLAKKPTHLLVIDETESDLRDGSFGAHGRREVFSIASDLSLFRVYRPGKHRISVFAFAWQGDVAKSCAISLLRKDGEVRYLHRIKGLSLNALFRKMTETK